MINKTINLTILSHILVLILIIFTDLQLWKCMLYPIVVAWISLFLWLGIEWIKFKSEINNNN